jgi:hypothetical protein
VPPRPPEVIFDEIMQRKGRHAGLGRRLARNRPRNWLVAIMLNSMARLDGGEELTDLDQALLGAFREHGFSDEYLKQRGRLLKTMPGNVRRDFFPGKFGDFDGTKRYTFADLEADRTGIIDETLKMPNVMNIDVEAIHAGRAHLRDFAPVPPDVARAHGGEMLIAVTPTTKPPNPTYRIKATSFRCIQETPGWGSDEPFWVFGTIAGQDMKRQFSSKSHEYDDDEAVDSGDPPRTFPSTEGWIWGQGTAEDIPAGDVGAIISLWEYDGGDTTEAREITATVISVAATIGGTIQGWVAAVIGAIGTVLQIFLAFLDNDHIADQNFIFTRQTIDDQLGKGGGSFTQSRKFANDDGTNYLLTITLSKFA